MRKRIISCIGIVIISFILWLGIQNWDINKTDLFFLWCEGYVAGEHDTEEEITFTFYSRDKQMDKKIVNADFGESSALSVEDYHIQKLESKYKDYQSYGLFLTLNFGEETVIKEDCIYLTFRDGTVQVYKVGTWCFDIGAEDSGIINTWESPGASSSSEKFTYTYKTEEKALESCVVYAGENITGKVEKIKDDTIEGCIDISENQSPLKYVKSKILFTIDGKEYISYGNGCLCGALSFDEDDMKLSQQR